MTGQAFPALTQRRRRRGTSAGFDSTRAGPAAARRAPTPPRRERRPADRAPPPAKANCRAPPGRAHACEAGQRGLRPLTMEAGLGRTTSSPLRRSRSAARPPSPSASRRWRASRCPARAGSRSSCARAGGCPAPAPPATSSSRPSIADGIRGWITGRELEGVGWHGNQQGADARLGITDHTAAGPGGQRLGQAARVFEWGGRAPLVLGATMDACSIVRASKPLRRSVQVATARAAAAAGSKGAGSGGAGLGTAITPGPAR